MAQTRLFAVTSWVINIALGVCVFGTGVLLFCLGCLAVVGTGIWVPKEVPAMLEGVPRSHVVMIVALAVLAGIAILALAILVFQALRQIVASAIDGDPFVIENADRLARIGWLLVGICGLEFAANAVIAVMIPAQLKDHFQFDFGGDVSPLSLLAILLVFVLAQIFRHGSQMRAELEGTV